MPKRPHTKENCRSSIGAIGLAHSAKESEKISCADAAVEPVCVGLVQLYQIDVTWDHGYKEEAIPSHRELQGRDLRRAVAPVYAVPIPLIVCNLGGSQTGFRYGWSRVSRPIDTGAPPNKVAN